MLRKVAILGLMVAAMAGAAFAQEGQVPKGIPHLDHVFVIMMENHGYNQVVNNPNEPFVNRYARSANTGTNYFAIAHPSLTNYLEVVGGSNFGVLNDNSPDWHNATCTTNLASGITSLDNGTFPNICPIYGSGHRCGNTGNRLFKRNHRASGRHQHRRNSLPACQFPHGRAKRSRINWPLQD